jgi:hypothetical protein
LRAADNPDGDSAATLTTTHVIWYPSARESVSALLLAAMQIRKANVVAVPQHRGHPNVTAGDLHRQDLTGPPANQ